MDFKFKKEWFDVLNRCDRALRIEVIEAVFQYFFTGLEPHFDDDARKIAFGFIRADIDAARRRRQKRQAAKDNNTQPADADTAVPAQVPTKNSAPAPAPTKAPASNKPQPPDFLESEALRTVITLWNNSVRDTNFRPIVSTRPLDSEEYHPALKAIRRVPFNSITDALKGIRQRTDVQSFASFFNSL
ncbi:MAG: hypothetical protein HDT04_04620 [Bacteroidales bacterium]|nr:hypothetical protein [Bacteroidales bacterium]